MPAIAHGSFDRRRVVERVIHDGAGTARGGRSTTVGPSGTMRGSMIVRTTQLTIPEPFSLRATALSHGWHECAPMHWCDAAGCLQVIERDGDMPVRLSMVDAPSRGGQARVRLTVEADEISDNTLSLMRSRAGVMLRADLDLTGFHALAAETPVLKPILSIGAGRLIRSASMAENIIKTICGTNVNWAQAVKMINRIAQLGPYIRNHRNLNAWPTCGEILKAGDDYLLGVARVGYRTKSIRAFCRSVVDGAFDPDALDAVARTESTDVLCKRLTAISGVGPASAAFLLGLLGRFDKVGVDSWTIAYTAERYFNGRKPTVRQVEKLFARYGEWRHLAWWFEQWQQWETAKSMLNGGNRHQGPRARRHQA
ncbi:MAG: hypothetical protein HOP29_19040 [Phycisphaerales bacterium]|nr:hypothetical protein [Phycisphaerales bacterium]